MGHRGLDSKLQVSECYLCDTSLAVAFVSSGVKESCKKKNPLGKEGVGKEMAGGEVEGKKAARKEVREPTTTLLAWTYNKKVT